MEREEEYWLFDWWIHLFVWEVLQVNPVLFMSLFGHALFNYNPPKRSREVWWFFELMGITLEHMKRTGLKLDTRIAWIEIFCGVQLLLRLSSIFPIFYVYYWIMWHHEWEHFSSHPLSSRLPVIQRARLAPPWYLVTIISLAIRLQATSYEGDNQSIGGKCEDWARSC